MKRAILLTTASISAAIAAALATIALVLVTSGSNPAIAASTLVNGNFETGDLSGWSVDTTKSGGEAKAVTSYCPALHEYYYGTCNEQSGFFDEVFPKEGSYFARITPGGVTTEGVFEDAIISQSFKASNGDRVSGWAFFLPEDWSSGVECLAGFPICGWNNVTGQVVIRSDSGTTVATPFQQSYSRHTVAGDSGWMYWEHTFTDLTGEGSFQLEARTNDSYLVDSSIGLDDVKISTLSTDTTKPSTTATPSAAPNSAGWNNSDVKVHLSATDNEGGSGVKQITYSASGAQTIAKTDASGNSADVNLNAQGTTTLTYYATDKAGNVEDQKTLTLKIDKTAPTVSSVSPTSGAKNAALSTSVAGTFSEEMDPATLSTSTVTLVKSGTTTPLVSATVNYDATDKKVTLKPSSPLVASTTYTATVKGGAQGAKDKAGNPLGSDRVWSFTTARK